MQPHIFELFSQAQRSAGRSQGGLGIGLALVKSLVELHHGRISCFGEGLEKGSRFRIEFPLLHGFDDRRDLRTRKGGPKKTGRKRKVLIVDDNADAARTLATLLNACGDEVLV